MDTIKNIHFTLLIKINKRKCEFNFRQRSDVLYDADTSDERGNRYFFKMVNPDGSWIIEGKDLPAWIKENEESIQLALKDK